MKTHHGWIALDIDGTITDQAHHIDSKVADYLKSLHESGWKIIFITGRTLSFGTTALKCLNFPFLLGVQNGADILQMPEKKSLMRHYLPGNVVTTMESLYSDQPDDFLVYSGYESGDFCYFRPKRFSPRVLKHLEKIKALSPEAWQEVDSFQFATGHAFPLIKCLGFYDEMAAIHAALCQMETIAVSLIRDPLDEEIYLNLVTAPSATKGKALERVVTAFGKQERVIAAGDDRNDISMLQYADIAIAMQNAPQAVLDEADIIAKPASDLGIIDALKSALSL